MHHQVVFVLLCCLAVTVVGDNGNRKSAPAAASGNIVMATPTNTSGFCESLWRPEKLEGKCNGLKLHTTYNHPNVSPILRAAPACKAACCAIGHCAVWQYDKSSQQCMLGPVVHPAAEALQCEATGSLEGGRKCIRGFCAGLEDQILPLHETKMKAKGMLPHDKRHNIQHIPDGVKNEVLKGGMGGGGGASPAGEAKVAGKCAGLWRPEPLRGECPGLEPLSSFPEVAHLVEKMTSAGHCRTACCLVGDKCATWQFNNDSKECKLGSKAVKLAAETLTTPHQCSSDGNFVGGRKCVRGKCGGLENTYLGLAAGPGPALAPK